MPKNLIQLKICFAVVLVVDTLTAMAQPTQTSLKEVGDLLVGRWISEIVWAVDYPGLGNKGEKVTGYESCRWITDGAAIECDSLVGKAVQKTIFWWEPASKQIRIFNVDSGGNWAEGTISREGYKLVAHAVGSFADGRRVEYKWEDAFQNNGSSRTVTGATIVSGVRNEFRDTYKRVAN